MKQKQKVATLVREEICKHELKNRGNKKRKKHKSVGKH